MKLYYLNKIEKNLTIRLGEWESDEVFFIKELRKIKKGWTVLDVGSQFGYYAIKFAPLVGNTGKVLAIEAHPQVYRVLKMNLKLHGLADSVVPICKAAGNKNAEVILCEIASSGDASTAKRVMQLNLDWGRVYKWLQFVKTGSFLKIIRERYAPIRYLVPVNTLDKIAEENNLEKIDLVKIDVEGAELEVLEGCHNILKRDMPILMVEVHFGFDWNPETLYEMLRKVGYELTMEKREYSQKALVIAHPK